MSITLERLQQIKEGVEADLATKTQVKVGLATCGISAGAKPVLDAFVRETAGMPGVDVKLVGCTGICRFEPQVEIYEPNGQITTYVNVKQDKVARIVKEHLQGGKVITEFLPTNIK